MDINVSMGTIVLIAYTPKKVTRSMRQQRTQWVVVCYTNGCIQHIVWNALADGVGREKGVVNQV